MREVLIILAVIVVLLGLTALRYRKQLKQLFGVAKMLKEAKDSAASQVPTQRKTDGVKLASCSKCGVFVPETNLSGGLCSKCRS
ncbi:MAG TPA: hypothetical protein PKA82_05725 [Pyrinomonadaceae bacterium]|nr:hypothetical protein [Pyrinomonadaceae bacterium]